MRNRIMETKAQLILKIMQPSIVHSFGWIVDRIVPEYIMSAEEVKDIMKELEEQKKVRSIRMFLKNKIVTGYLLL